MARAGAASGILCAMLDLFLKGGPVMWPLLATSLVTLSVVIERLLFVRRRWRQRLDSPIE